MTTLTKSYITGAGSGQLLYETIGNCFDRIAEQYPDNEALVVGFQNIRWSYSELKNKVDELATGLIALGIEPGDRIGIWGPNSYEWLLTQLATAKIGAIMVCINPAYRVYELEYALNKVECKAIITAESFKSSQYLNLLQEVAPELKNCNPGQLKASKLPHLTTVIRMGEEKTAGMYNFSDVCKTGGEKEYSRLSDLKIELQPDDAINIQFTSGTTGHPKGATLSHNNILNNGLITGQAMQFTDSDRLCMPVPLYHCFGMVLSVLACMTHGATIVMSGQSFDPISVLETVHKEKCTALNGVPTMFVMELDHPDFAKFDLSTLRTGIIAGAPCPEELMNDIMNKLYMKQVIIAYGQTELSPINHMTSSDDTIENKTQTVGRAIPYVEIKLINEQGRVTAIGEQGEICTRGYSVMSHYWNDEEKTADTIKKGWLHSGDLGTMDEHGYVRITGRIKDMVIRGGENVYPREVEEFLYTHTKISEAQVFGVPDKKMGEEVCAWIQLKNNETATEEEIREFCKGKITHFKIPRYIRFVTEYPMTVTGKIRKIDMREAMEKELSS